MHVINFLLKWFFNFLFWVITFMVLTKLIPAVVVGFASNAVVDPIDLKGLGAGRIFIGQLIACLLLLGAAWGVMKWDEIKPKTKKSEKKNTTPAITKTDANTKTNNEANKKWPVIPEIPRFIQEEGFSVALNFSNVCLVIGSFFDPWFFIYSVLGMILTAIIGFLVMDDK